MRMVTQFNVSWSAGKGSGMLLGGILLEAAGAPVVSSLAALSFVVAALVLPWMDRPRDHSAVIEADPVRPNPLRQRAFLRSAWIANGVGFGAVATVNHHFPRLALQRGLDPSDVGKLLGAVFLTQTLFFLQSGARRWWHYRSAPLLALQLALGAVLLGIGVSSQLPWLLLLGAALGVTLGFAYQSSIYYSLDSPTGRGGLAGVHEAVLGLTSAAIPWIGGQLVADLGDLAPFTFAAICVAASVAHSAVRLTRAPLRTTS
jgi:predicted MFS family arabinose efflux permease